MLHIKILEGEGAVYAPGSKARTGLVIQVTDETGSPVDGAAVSFRLPEEGPGGTFARSMKTEIATTTPDGRAAAYGLECNRNTGPFQVRVTAVKQQVRAGVVVSQYISERVTSAASPLKASGAPSGKRKWLILGALAGGAAAGLVVAMPRSSSPATAAAVAAPPAQIGLPTITIGKP